MPRFIVVLGLALLLSPVPLLAEETGRIGPEFEFRSSAHLWVTGGLTLALPGVGYLPAWVADRFVSQYYIGKMFAVHRRLCRQRGNCKVTRTRSRTPLQWLRGGGYRVTYADGFWFELIKDPHVVEVIAKPLSLEGWKQEAPRLQRDLFDVAREVGMAPPTLFSGGHMSFGLRETFGDDPQLFRNFLVDFANHSELASGIFKNDAGNAAALAKDPKRLRAFREVIHDFDQGKIEGIHGLARAIHERVNQGREKADAISLYTILQESDPSKQRLEIRGMRAQQTAAHFVLLSQLFLDRLAYLKRRGGRIPVTDSPPVTDEALGAQRFYQYLKESGHEWKEHAPFLPPRYRRLAQPTPGHFVAPPRSSLGRCRDALAKMGGL